MKILFDHQTFTEQKYGGISRYFFEIMNHFYITKTLDFELSVKYSNNEYLKTADFCKVRNFYPESDNIISYLIMRQLNQQYTCIKLKAGDFDVFHPTYYGHYFISHKIKKPIVVTFHDMIHEKLGNQYHLSKKVKKSKLLLIEKAVRIISVSQSTKNDILEIYGEKYENKIEVIYHGCSIFNNSNKNLPNTNIPEVYILFVGFRGLYKNFKFFIEAVRPLLLNNKDLFLVCAGGEAFTKSEIKLLTEKKILSKVKHYKITDNILVNLYLKAICFVFPSLYEGFGIPILEAFSCGCPCLLSNTSSFPEVGDDAALYFNPKDKNSIYDSVKELVNNNSLQKSLRERGYERIKDFSWIKTSEKTLKVYESII